VFRSRNTRAGRFRPSRITRKCDACSRRRIGPRPLPVAATARLGSTSRCRGSERGHQNACPNPASPSGQPLELRAGLLSCCFARPGVSGGSAAGPLVSGTGGWGGHAGWTRSLFTLSRPLVPDTSRPEGGPSGSSGRSIRRSLLSTCSLRAPPQLQGRPCGAGDGTPVTWGTGLTLPAEATAITTIPGQAEPSGVDARARFVLAGHAPTCPTESWVLGSLSAPRGRCWRCDGGLARNGPVTVDLPASPTPAGPRRGPR